jgi:hypothetical protein
MADDRLMDEFFNYGCQYYVAGRYGVFARLMPVAANLQHHGIEMLLKGALANTMTLPQMKARLGHRLEDAWTAFKAAAPDPAALSRFDDVVSELNKFEEIRYPDELLAHGALMNFEVIRAGAATGPASGAPVPQYKLCLEDLDELVAEIFKIAGRNPDAFLRTEMMKGDAETYLKRANAYFK